MDISIYFTPIDVSWYSFGEKRTRFGDVIDIFSDKDNFPDYSDYDIAIIGVEEDRNAINNLGCANAPDEVRKQLYKLFTGDYSPKIVDFGNIKRGDTVDDTYYALFSTVSTLLRHKVFPLIIGGSQDLTFANYKAYENNGQIINIAAIDPKFDLGSSEQSMDSTSYLSKIILYQPSYLFNFTNIGYQTYFVEQESIDLMEALFFDIYRLGDIHADIKKVEPLLRNADMLSFDISAIRSSDARGNNNASPNGFYGEEACRLCWYAGMSDKLTSAGFYEVNPTKDANGQTSFLVAEMIWYFIDGFYHRRAESPNVDDENFIIYHVQIDDCTDDIIFYKSKKTNRWWMQVLEPENVQKKYERHYIIPCSYDDYKKAASNEIPERWWQAYKKLT